MNNPQQHSDLFDAYLLDEMEANQRVKFEQLLETDESVRKAFELHQTFVRDLQDAMEYQDIRNTLRTLHQKPGIAERPFLLSPKFYIPLSIAAGLALLITVISPFVYQGEDTMLATRVNPEEYAAESPTEASTEEEAYEKIVSENVSEERDEMQTSLANTWSKRVSTQTIATALLISSQGYFLSVLSGTDSVYLLQNGDKTFEAGLIYRDETNGFSVLRSHPDLATEFKIPPILVSGESLDTIQRVRFFGFFKNQQQLYEDSLIWISSKDHSKKSTQKMAIRQKSQVESAGAPAFSRSGHLIGIGARTEKNKPDVTYLIDVHYIGMKLEELQKKYDISMHRNYTPGALSVKAFEKKVKPFIYEVHLP